MESAAELHAELERLRQQLSPARAQLPVISGSVSAQSAPARPSDLRRSGAAVRRAGGWVVAAVEADAQEVAPRLGGPRIMVRIVEDQLRAAVLKRYRHQEQPLEGLQHRLAPVR